MTKTEREDLLNRWLARLRDPKSKQAHGFLQYEEEDSYCCLGHLLCVMHDIRGGAVCLSPHAKRIGECLTDNFWQDFNIGIDQDTLTDLNDGDGNLSEPLSLSEIADYIEDHARID